MHAGKSSGHNHRELRVLIVDDNPDDADLMCATLEDAGYEVEPCRVDTAADFVRVLEQYWDLILCDYSLPRLGAPEVLRLLHEQHRTFPLVLVSGRVNDETVVELMHRGVDEFVPKRNLGMLGPVTRRVLECTCQGNHAADKRSDAPDWRKMCGILEQSLTRARSSMSRLALATFDVDRFHRINHGLGYEHGEELLCAIGERMSEVMGTKSYAGRLRGDEYLAVFEGFDGRVAVEAQVVEMMKRLRKPFCIAGIDINVSFSAGVALFPDHGNDASSLLREAEAAMLEAKRVGRGTYRMAEFSIARSEGVRLEHELYRALERRQFTVEYQPQVEIGTGKVLGVEALVRWDHPDLGRVAPSKFIPLAEESGEIMRIGAWVLRTACSDAAQWRQLAGAKDLRVAVNLSARQFLHIDLVGLVRQSLSQTQLDPGALDLELTESVLISDPDEATKRLSIFRDMGVRTSVDDFGTGYSSLSYLKRFPLDVLKIDQSFVSDIVHDKRAASVISAVISLGRGLGMDLIAEGVETREQADALRAFGCDTAQGFLFSRPLRPDQITALLGGVEPPSAQEKVLV